MSDTINTTNFHPGRFGNHLILGLALNFIAIKNDLKCTYKMYNEMKSLGIDLFISGKKTYNETIDLNNSNFYQFIISDCIYKNIRIVNNVWCQTEEFANYLRNYFNDTINKEKIIKANRYSQRYNSNNDCCLHVRLGDLTQRDDILYHGYEYYDRCLSKITFDKGYITSDSIDHPICKKLIDKYNLIPFTDDEINTIMFASTCKNVILSSGTFSWTIGILSYFSTIFYPINYPIWHGNIFVFNDWIPVNAS